MNKIAIGLSVHRAVEWQTVAALVALLSATKGMMKLLMVPSPYIVHNRTQIVLQALGAGCTHLFFMDADITCPAFTINQLLDSGKRVVGCAYNKRPSWAANDSTTDRISTVQPLVDGKPFGIMRPHELPNELFQCGGLGTGAMLIDLSVFQEIEKPWFDIGRDESGAVTISDDFWFCRQCISAGIDIWCDPTIQIGHIGAYAY